MGFAMENGERMPCFRKHFPIVFAIAESVDVCFVKTQYSFEITKGGPFAHLGVIRFAIETFAPMTKRDALLFLDQGFQKGVLCVDGTKHRGERIFLKRGFEPSKGMRVETMRKVLLKIAIFSQEVDHLVALGFHRGDYLRTLGGDPAKGLLWKKP